MDVAMTKICWFVDDVNDDDDYYCYCIFVCTFGKLLEYYIII